MRVHCLVQAIERAPRPLVLVGSSFGGIAGLVAALVATAQGSIKVSLHLGWRTGSPGDARVGKKRLP